LSFPPKAKKLVRHHRYIHDISHRVTHSTGRTGSTHAKNKKWWGHETSEARRASNVNVNVNGQIKNSTPAPGGCSRVTHDSPKF
jgi:hypothetical protein